MTMIATAFNQSIVCVSTDTQLTFASDGRAAGEATKSNYIKCKDGKFLTAYTGNDVYLENGVHVSDWITRLLSDSSISTKNIHELIQELVRGLNEKYYYKSRPEGLVILIAGWVLEGNNTSLAVFRVTNCETEEESPCSPKKKVFDI